MAESLAKSIQAASSAAKQVKAVRDDLTGRRGKLHAQIATLKERNAWLHALPVNLEDGKGFVLECVDISARQFVARVRYPKFIESFAEPQRGWPGGLQGRSDRPLALDDIVAARKGGLSSLANGPLNFFVGNSSLNGLAVDADALCFFFGDAIKAKLEAHLDDWYPDYTKNTNAKRRPQCHGHYENATPEELASSIDERLAEIRANEAQIEKLEQECYELDDALASLGAPTEEGGQ